MLPKEEGLLRKDEVDHMADQFEAYMNDIDQDPELRGAINLYKGTKSAASSGSGRRCSRCCVLTSAFLPPFPAADPNYKPPTESEIDDDEDDEDVRINVDDVRWGWGWGWGWGWPAFVPSWYPRPVADPRAACLSNPFSPLTHVQLLDDFGDMELADDAMAADPMDANDNDEDM